MLERRGGARLRPSTRKGQREKHMNYQILFAALCAVIAANILVAVIAIVRAYREENRIGHVPAWPRMRRSLRFERR